MTCAKHPDIARALDAERTRVRRLAEALDRYGRHEKGCPMLRPVARLGACDCGLHARIREGGVRP